MALKIKYSRTFKLLSAISAVLFLLGFVVLFFPTIEAKVTEVRYASFQQGGYEGLPYSNFMGSTSTLLFATYEYKVDSKKYNSWGLAEGYDGKSVFVKYVPISPSITFSSSTPYFVFCGFFLFLAFGVRSIVVWCINMINKSAS